MLVQKDNTLKIHIVMQDAHRPLFTGTQTHVVPLGFQRRKRDKMMPHNRLLYPNLLSQYSQCATAGTTVLYTCGRSDQQVGFLAFFFF